MDFYITRHMMMEPFFVNFRQERGGDTAVAGSLEVISTVSSITGLTMPNEYPTLAQNWTEILHDAHSLAYNQLKTDLAQLEATIDERNLKRRFRNMDFHPTVAAISIFS